MATPTSPSCAALQVVTVADSGRALPHTQSSPSLRFRGQIASPIVRPVHSARYESVDKSMHRAATTAAIGCSLLLASLALMLVTGSVTLPVFGAPASDNSRRHEIHLKPTVQSKILEDINAAEYGQSDAGKARNAVLYTVFGEWNSEVEWEFLRLVSHVTRSPLLTNFDVVLLLETADSAEISSRSGANREAIQATLASHPGRVSIYQVTATQAAGVFPPTSFQHGFYYNPEAAAIMFATAHPGYDFLWLLESDARWTGDWAQLFLEPYITAQTQADLFVFRSPTPWMANAPGWETSNCFTKLKNYPKGWRSRGENATNLPVEWGERIACFMPNKRLSSKLISTLNATYLSGEGGYNEVAVPTINSVMGGSFGTASEACMLYTFKNAQAAAAYDAFRIRAAGAAASSENNHANYVDEKIPCLLHPVKGSRGLATATPAADNTGMSSPSVV